MKKLLLMLSVLTVFASYNVGNVTKAHEKYPYSCCGNYDCAPISGMYRLPNGDWSITIALEDGIRSAIFPRDHTILPSSDGKDHACILRRYNFQKRRLHWEPRCLFMHGDI